MCACCVSSHHHRRQLLLISSSFISPPFSVLAQARSSQNGSSQEQPEPTRSSHTQPHTATHRDCGLDWVSNLDIISTRNQQLVSGFPLLLNKTAGRRTTNINRDMYHPRLDSQEIIRDNTIPNTDFRKYLRCNNLPEMHLQKVVAF